MTMRKILLTGALALLCAVIEAQPIDEPSLKVSYDKFDDSTRVQVRLPLPELDDLNSEGKVLVSNRAALGWSSVFKGPSPPADGQVPGLLDDLGPIDRGFRSIPVVFNSRSRPDPPLEMTLLVDGKRFRYESLDHAVMWYLDPLLLREMSTAQSVEGRIQGAGTFTLTLAAKNQVSHFLDAIGTTGRSTFSARPSPQLTSSLNDLLVAAPRAASSGFTSSVSMTNDAVLLRHLYDHGRAIGDDFVDLRYVRVARCRHTNEGRVESVQLFCDRGCAEHSGGVRSGATSRDVSLYGDLGGSCSEAIDLIQALVYRSHLLK